MIENPSLSWRQGSKLRSRPDRSEISGVDATGNGNCSARVSFVFLPIDMDV